MSARPPPPRFDAAFGVAYAPPHPRLFGALLGSPVGWQADAGGNRWRVIDPREPKAPEPWRGGD